MASLFEAWQAYASWARMARPVLAECERLKRELIVQCRAYEVQLRLKDAEHAAAEDARRVAHLRQLERQRAANQTVLAQFEAAEAQFAEAERQHREAARHGIIDRLATAVFGPGAPPTPPAILAAARFGDPRDRLAIVGGRHDGGRHDGAHHDGGRNGLAGGSGFGGARKPTAVPLAKPQLARSKSAGNGMAAAAGGRRNGQHPKAASPRRPKPMSPPGRGEWRRPAW